MKVSRILTTLSVMAVCSAFSTAGNAEVELICEGVGCTPDCIESLKNFEKGGSLGDVIASKCEVKTEITEAGVKQTVGKCKKDFVDFLTTTCGAKCTVTCSTKVK